MDLRRSLIGWFDQHARDLPFRRTRDPYAIWVSEIMLQQTRVDTVLPYYERFMERFPTPEAMAEAEQDEVLSLWSGLGYYRRARLLHRGVKEVVARYGGKVPEDRKARLSLPGIGRYTAGAIGSIAFDANEPLVDGNVARVFSRLYAIQTPLGRSDTEQELWRRAEALVAGPRPGTLNQALMELGATVCTKTNPSCDACPIAEHCQASADGRVAELPVAKVRTPPRPTPTLAVLATAPTEEGSGAVWLTRGDDALFGGLWNLPMVFASERKAALALLRKHGLQGRLPMAPCAELEHVLSHRRLQIRLYRAECSATETTELRAFSATELPGLGLSTLTRKALRLGGFAG